MNIVGCISSTLNSTLDMVVFIGGVLRGHSTQIRGRTVETKSNQMRWKSHHVEICIYLHTFNAKPPSNWMDQTPKQDANALFKGAEWTACKCIIFCIWVECKCIQVHEMHVDDNLTNNQKIQAES